MLEQDSNMTHAHCMLEYHG